jgi:hypothetical protein
MAAPFYMLRIEIDGHFHGSPDVPKPWVARIGGADAKYGLAREFIKPMNDWRDASKAWSGNLYGVVATFALREGALYEVSRLRGRSSKRHVSREFVWVEDRKMHHRTPDEALAHADGDDGPAFPLELRDAEPYPWVAHVAGLGTPRRLGFVVVDHMRRYRLCPGEMYEVVEPGERHRFCVAGERVEWLEERSALEWLLARAA